MGNWSPYSEEWEKQRINKKAEEARAAYEKNPRLYRAMGTIRSYETLLLIHLRRLFDRKYREEMVSMQEKTLNFFVDMVKDDDTMS